MSGELIGDSSASVAFLRFFRPEGPWVLTSIPIDQTGLASATFSPAQEKECRAWIDERNGKQNIYFTVNPLLRPMDGSGAKAKKIDVKAMAWLHVDVDPRAGEPLDKERERALKVLREYGPPPTIIIDSGGGYQGFWKLAEEQQINGDENRATELEAYNLQIELNVTAASQCFNIDRIMRLPGTINVPTKKKLKKGRVPALACVIETHPERVYQLNVFAAAQRVQNKENGLNDAASRVTLSGNLKYIDLNTLPEGVSQYIKMVIVQGGDPDEPAKYPSRSEAVFAVTCGLVRGGCDDDTIGAILLDKEYGISGHILSQPRPREYAARQIQRAREEAVHPQLRRLNEMHAVIEDTGGKCLIVSEAADDTLGRSQISRQTFDHFRNRYMNVAIVIGKDDDGNPKTMPLGKWWLSHPARRQYKTLTFAPGRETPNAYNLWKGFACESRPGDCSLFLAHTKDNICSGNEEYYDYLMNYMARCVQHPNSQGETAIVLRGEMGTGKGKFSHTFGSLWGRHYLQVSEPRHLTGNFNAHLRDCVVLFADEAFFAGDKRHESVLKTLITEPTINIEVKGVDIENCPNYVHLIMASNSSWVVPSNHGERRYFVLDVSKTRIQDFDYFAAMDRQMNEGGREALLHLLMTRDISKFQVRNAPKTAALLEQKERSMDPTEEWWHETLTNGKIGFNKEWVTEIAVEELNDAAIRYFTRQSITRRPTQTQINKFLDRVMPTGLPIQFQKVGEMWVGESYGQQKRQRARASFLKIADLEECRHAWDNRYGTRFNWPPIVRVEEDSKEEPTW